MQSLKDIAVLSGTQTIQTFRSPINVLWMLIVPIVFSVAIGALFSSPNTRPPAVYVVNEDGTAAAQALIQGLEATPADVYLVSREEAMSEIAAGKYTVAVVLPSGFEQSISEGYPAIELLHHEDHVGPDPMEARAKTVARSLAAGTEIGHGYVIHQTPNGREADDAFVRVRGVFGIYLVFLLSALLTRGASLHKDRENGTLQRIIALGVPYGHVVAAHAASIFLVGVVQSILFLLITGLLGTHWLTGGWLELTLAIVVTLFVGSGIAVGLSGLLRSAGAIQGLGGGLPPVLAMAGGAFFPLEIAPAALQQLARINPVYWAVEALVGGMIFDGVASQFVPLSVLILVGVMSMIIGVQGLRRLEL